MAIKPVAVELRGYQVGFGDCFLLSFIYGENDKRHVLIDFGTTELPGTEALHAHAQSGEADRCRLRQQANGCGCDASACRPHQRVRD